MSQIKHVGRIKGTNKKVLVAYRTLPGDAYNCLVIQTENLDSSRHDALVMLVENIAGQQSYELAEALHRTQFPDGSYMLAWLHSNDRLIKMPTDKVEMAPVPGYYLLLSELNQQIAEARGVAIDDLSLKDDPKKLAPQNVNKKEEPIPTQEVTNTVSLKDYIHSLEKQIETLTAEEKATWYELEADKLVVEATALRQKATSLSPTTKKTVKNSKKEKSA